MTKTKQIGGNLFGLHARTNLLRCWHPPICDARQFYISKQQPKVDRCFRLFGAAACGSPGTTADAIMKLSKHGGIMILSKNHPLFGRLIQSGRNHLLQNGFEESDAIPSCHTLEFIWPSKKVMDQITTSSALQKNDFDHPLAMPVAKVRPYPGKVTDGLDDKRRLAQLVEQYASEYRDIAPTVVTCTPNHDNVMTHLSLSPSPTGRYFVKHRCGVQGKSVYCFNTVQLVEWCNAMNTNTRGVEDFVIQHEVAPALWENRKFLLRAHVLVTSTCKRGDGSDAIEHEGYLHHHIICQHHAVDYDSNNTNDKLSHTSHSGSGLKCHPLPSLTTELHPHHPAADCWDEVKSVCKVLMKMFQGQLDYTQFRSDVGGESMRDDGKVLVCEVNTHPALGWGTMANVPSKVYPDIVQDTLDILLYSGGGARMRIL